MRKALFSLVFVMGTVLTVLGQDATPYGKSDPKAKAILDKASQKYTSYNSLKADFTQQVFDTESKLLNSQKGTIWLKGDKFKFTLGEQIVSSDNKTLWSYNKELNEVQVSDYEEPEEGEITPSSLFTNFYDKDFLYRLQGSDQLDGRAVDVIELTPLDKSKPYFKILAWVDKKDFQLRGLKIFLKGGYRQKYIINDYKPDVSLENSTFTFSKSKHPGVEVVDLRM